jgi:hypothetical protein
MSEVKLSTKNQIVIPREIAKNPSAGGKEKNEYF